MEFINELKEFLEKECDTILSLDDQFLFDTYGKDREDLKTILNSETILLDNFDAKMKEIYILADPHITSVSSTGGLSPEIDTLMNQLIITDYLKRFDQMKYKMNFLVSDLFKVNFIDSFYFLFLSFADCLVDDYDYTPDMMKEIYKCVILYNTVPITEKIKEFSQWENVLADLNTYIMFMKKHDINLMNWHYITNEIMNTEFRKPTVEGKQILFNRMYVNCVMTLGFKKSIMPVFDSKINLEKEKRIFIHKMMMLGVIHDDIEDLNEDINNDAPTYIRWLFENNCEKDYIKNVNRITAYIYLSFYNDVKKYFKETDTYVPLLIDMIKILLLRNHT